jgi:hypothetical protein
MLSVTKLNEPHRVVMWQTLYITMKMYIYGPVRINPPPNGGRTLEPPIQHVPPLDPDYELEKWLMMSYLMSFY